MTCRSCIGRFFGILASNVFFVALLAMCIAVFTMRWLEANQTDVPINGVLTDASLKFGVFDMSARITQAGQVVWSQYSYSWCNDQEVKDPKAPWSHEGVYCNLLLTAQGCCIVCLAFGLTAGVIAAFLSAGVINRRKFRDVACASAFFMLVEFLTALIAFACFFGIETKINQDLKDTWPGVRVKPSYSVACAVLCAGLVLLGFITTSALGGCGKGPEPADMADDDDVETGRPLPRRGSSKKPQAPAPVAPSAPEAGAAGAEVKESQ